MEEIWEVEKVIRFWDYREADGLGWLDSTEAQKQFNINLKAVGQKKGLMGACWICNVNADYY